MKNHKVDKMLLPIIVMVVCNIFLTQACGILDGAKKEIYLVCEYTNDSGNNPEVTVNKEETSSEVSFASNDIQVSHKANLVGITINNVNISDEEGNYVITSLEVQEEVRGQFSTYSEFSWNVSKFTNIAVVLVLDVSESLEDKFPEIKEFAKEFAREVFKNDENAQIAVVAFSTDIDTLDFTNDISRIENYIDGLGPGKYTALYDAMLEGSQMLLSDRLNVDGRAMVTFTDGSDNNSNNESYDLLVKTLEASAIKSYTIGLEDKDKVNRNELENLAVNGVFELTDSLSDLKKIFKKFSESVSDVYSIYYERNDQRVPEPRKIRFVIGSERKGKSQFTFPFNFKKD